MPLEQRNQPTSFYVEIIERLVRIEEAQKAVTALAAKVSSHEDKLDKLDLVKERIVIFGSVFAVFLLPVVGGSSWPELATKALIFIAQ